MLDLCDPSCFIPHAVDLFESANRRSAQERDEGNHRVSIRFCYMAVQDQGFCIRMCAQPNEDMVRISTALNCPDHLAVHLSISYHISDRIVSEKR